MNASLEKKEVRRRKKKNKRILNYLNETVWLMQIKSSTTIHSINDDVFMYLISKSQFEKKVMTLIVK